MIEARLNRLERTLGELPIIRRWLASLGTTERWRGQRIPVTAAQALRLGLTPSATLGLRHLHLDDLADAERDVDEYRRRRWPQLGGGPSC
jgi:hypothetical protein